MKERTKQRRAFPKIRFMNYRKEFPVMGDNCFRDWFWIQRLWKNRLIFIHVKHFALVLDFRMDWVGDMVNHPPGNNQ